MGAPLHLPPFLCTRQVSNVRNFPSSRGSVVGVLKAAIGLSGARCGCWLGKCRPLRACLPLPRWKGHLLLLPAHSKYLPTAGSLFAAVYSGIFFPDKVCQSSVGGMPVLMLMYVHGLSCTVLAALAGQLLAPPGEPDARHHGARLPAPTAPPPPPTCACRPPSCCSWLWRRCWSACWPYPGSTHACLCRKASWSRARTCSLRVSLPLACCSAMHVGRMWRRDHPTSPERAVYTEAAAAEFPTTASRCYLLPPPLSAEGRFIFALQALGTLGVFLITGATFNSMYPLSESARLTVTCGAALLLLPLLLIPYGSGGLLSQKAVLHQALSYYPGQALAELL